MEKSTDAIAWAAGFLDGEGCFVLSKTGRPTYTTRSPEIKATQVVLSPLTKLEHILGGRIAQRTSKTSTGKNAFDWILRGGGNLRKVLPILIPHLTTKRDQAEVLLEYVQGMRPQGSGSYKLSNEESNRRKELIDMLSSLKNSAGYELLT